MQEYKFGMLNQRSECTDKSQQCQLLCALSHTTHSYIIHFSCYVHCTGPHHICMQNILELLCALHWPTSYIHVEYTWAAMCIALSHTTHACRIYFRCYVHCTEPHYTFMNTTHSCRIYFNCYVHFSEPHSCKIYFSHYAHCTEPHHTFMNNIL